LGLKRTFGVYTRPVNACWRPSDVPVFDYVERFYDPKRLHSTLGCLSPVAFEERAMLV
jgi:hypothetical protein